MNQTRKAKNRDDLIHLLTPNLMVKVFFFFKKKKKNNWTTLSKLQERKLSEGTFM